MLKQSILYALRAVQLAVCPIQAYFATNVWKGGGKSRTNSHFEVRAWRVNLAVSLRNSFTLPLF